MNRRSKIVVLSAIGITTLVLTTGWSVLAGNPWPPEPYQVYALAGAWAEMSDLDQAGAITIMLYSPDDPRSAMGSVLSTEINSDPTFGGMIPGATSQTPWFGTYQRTGPNSFQSKVVSYVKKDEKPTSVVLVVVVIEVAATMTSPNTLEAVGTAWSYSPDADKDGDGLPDVGEPPLNSFPIIQHARRI